MSYLNFEVIHFNDAFSKKNLHIRFLVTMNQIHWDITFTVFVKLTDYPHYTDYEFWSDVINIDIGDTKWFSNNKNFNHFDFFFFLPKIIEIIQLNICYVEIKTLDKLRAVCHTNSLRVNFCNYINYIAVFG